MRLLILGGVGFIGSSLAKLFANCGGDIVVFDNLKRRGSELNSAYFKPSTSALYMGIFALLRI